MIIFLVNIDPVRMQLVLWPPCPIYLHFVHQKVFMIWKNIFHCPVLFVFMELSPSLGIYLINNNRI